MEWIIAVVIGAVVIPVLLGMWLDERRKRPDAASNRE